MQDFAAGYMLAAETTELCKRALCCDNFSSAAATVQFSSVQFLGPLGRRGGGGGGGRET